MLLLLCVCLTLPSAVCVALEMLLLSKVGSGCQIYDVGGRAQRLNYPNSYDNLEGCALRVHATGTLVMDSFDTKSGCDFLTVGDVRLSGDLGPNTFDVAIGHHHRVDVRRKCRTEGLGLVRESNKSMDRFQQCRTSMSA